MKKNKRKADTWHMLSGPQTSRTPAAPARAPPRPGELLHSLVSHSAAWTRRYTRERLRELRAALGWQLRTAGSGDVSAEPRFLFRLRTLSRRVLWLLRAVAALPLR